MKLKDIIKKIVKQYEDGIDIKLAERYYCTIDDSTVDELEDVLGDYSYGFSHMALDVVSDNKFQVDITTLVYQLLNISNDALNILSRYEIVAHKLVQKDNIIKSYITPEYREKFIDDWFDETNKVVVVRHKNCNDGFGVEIVARDTREDITVLDLQHGEYNIEDVMIECRDAVVLIGDFSFPKNTYLQLKSITKNIVVLDHHETPFRDADDDMVGCIFDKTISGAVMVWKFFNPNKFAPNVITYIGDRDVWNWYFKDTKATGYLVDKLSSECNVVTNILDDGILKDSIGMYDALIDYTERTVDKQSVKGIDYIIGATTFYGINTNEQVSETLNRMSEITGTPTFAWWIQTRATDNKQIIILSLRNYKDDIDLSLVAGAFGGGGHRQSAGCAIELDKLDLEQFFINRNVVLR